MGVKKKKKKKERNQYHHATPKNVLDLLGLPASKSGTGYSWYMRTKGEKRRVWEELIGRGLGGPCTVANLEEVCKGAVRGEGRVVKRKERKG